MYEYLLDRVSREIAEIQNILDIDLISGFFVDTVMICVDDFHNTGTDCSVSQYSYINHLFLILTLI
jgi:hypothetical protein